MIKNVDKCNIAKIFSTEQLIFYKIPKYQREYTWGQKEWELLFNDVIENTAHDTSEYFLGSIIIVDGGSSVMEGANAEVIDGQQRITSLSILLLAFYDKLNQLRGQLTEDQNVDLINLKRELVILKNSQNTPRLTPQVQNHNRDDYFSLLCEKGLLPDQDHKPNAGNRRIYRAFSAFSKMIDNYLAENLDNPEDSTAVINCLFDMIRRFNSVIIVSIEVETHQDAYMLFESLNNRGVPLSAIDLIKNLLISTADHDHKSDECYTRWKQIINFLGDDYSVQERFFRQFYNAYRDELNDQAGLTTNGKTKYALGYLATKSTLLNIYEKLIKIDYNKLLDRLEKEAKIYALLTGSLENPDTNPGIVEQLAQLNRIQGAPAFLLLLYMFSNQEKLQLDDKILKRSIEVLVKFFVRRNITDFPNTRNLIKLFMDLVALISVETGEKVYTTIANFLRDNSSTDKTFKEKLNGSVYLNNPDATRFILCYYEEKFNTKENRTDLWLRDKSKKYIWTIEHIFPEGENIPNAWVEMIANGDAKKAATYLETYAHKLGNLTMTGYNSNLSNLSFDEKKNRKNSNGANIGYLNGLVLNNDVANKDTWQIDDIKNRTEKLVNFCLDEFSF